MSRAQKAQKSQKAQKEPPRAIQALGGFPVVRISHDLRQDRIEIAQDDAHIASEIAATRRESTQERRIDRRNVDDGQI